MTTQDASNSDGYKAFLLRLAMPLRSNGTTKTRQELTDGDFVRKYHDLMMSWPEFDARVEPVLTVEFRGMHMHLVLSGRYTCYAHRFANERHSVTYECMSLRLSPEKGARLLRKMCTDEGMQLPERPVVEAHVDEDAGKLERNIHI